MNYNRFFSIWKGFLLILVGFLLTCIGSEKYGQDSYDIKREFLFVFIGFQ